uniref:N-acetyltransferase domain-containing protein n=1 Tax=Plectus sambesii TaxID=2011161 RepID=A0A914X2W8_9BILA
MDEAEDFIKRHKDRLYGKPGEWVQYGIINNATGKLIGDCAIKLDEDDARIAVIGITISHLHQRQGFAKEVMTGILTCLFDTKQLHRIVETMDAENTAVINLMKSVGFRLEGHFVENIFFKGKWGSEFQYAMLKREWDARK